MGNTPEYNKRYYEKHKEKICQSKRSRYSDDPEYRKDCKARMRRNYRARERNRVDKRQRRLERKIQKQEVARRSTLKSRVVPFDGGMVEVFPLSILSKELGITSETLKRRWYPAGAVPEPTFIDKYGRFWFSRDFIDRLKKIVLESRSKCWRLEDFASIVQREWTATERGNIKESADAETLIL